MTGRTDFYVLDRDDARQRRVVACRPAEQATPHDGAEL